MIILKIIMFANTDWYLYNFRRSLAAALRDKGHDVLLVSPAGSYGEHLLALGFQWIPAPMARRSLNPIRELILLRWLWSLMRLEKPDIVHSFTIKCVIYGAIAGRLVGAGRVNAVAGMGYVFTNRGIKAQMLRPLVRALMGAALGGARARLILQNPDDVKFFEGARILPSSQIRLIPGSGVDCSRFVAPDQLRKGPRAPVVLFAARLLWDKGLAELVEAARILRTEGRTLQFVLAGAPDPGNPASVPQETVLAWQTEGLVRWLGHVNDIAALLGDSDMIVLPSYREGLPKTLIEAAACACALITTDVPGCRQVVTHEVDGLLVPARDAKALARAIARLQDDPALARRLGLAARDKALAEFDERIVIKRTLAVYDELLT